jgi:hypothetical protein
MAFDTFQLAAHRARQAYTTDEWINLRSQERAAAIYRELRQIDLENATGRGTKRRRYAAAPEPEPAASG